MKSLAYRQVTNLARLTDELLANVPALAPRANAAGEPVSVFHVEGTAKNVTITVADDVDPATVAAVVAAHDPTPRPPPPDPDVERDTAIAAATTLEELKSALLGETEPFTLAIRDTLRGA